MTDKKEQFLLIKSQSLNGNPLPVRRSVIAAARHNLREFDEPNSDIDTSLTQYNRVLFGPGTSAEIISLKNQIQAEWRYEQTRKDAAIAVEIVVSLKNAPAGISMEEYFLGAAKWAENWYKGKLISAVLHRDQACPHSHSIIMLDVGKGKPSGSAQIGFGKATIEMAKAFEREYSAKYGVKLPPPALIGPERRDAARQVIQHMTATGNPMVGAPGWPLVAAAIDKHPERMARELGLTLVPMSALRKLAQSTGQGPKTAAAEAAQDWRAQAAKAVRPIRTESASLPSLRDVATPMVVPQPSEAGQQPATTMGVAASPASSTSQASIEQHPSCVGVPILKVVVSDSRQNGEGLDDASEDEPGITRERDSEWLAEHYNPVTGDCRPPRARSPEPSGRTYWAINDCTEAAA